MKLPERRISLGSYIGKNSCQWRGWRVLFPLDNQLLKVDIKKWTVLMFLPNLAILVIEHGIEETLGSIRVAFPQHALYTSPWGTLPPEFFENLTSPTKNMNLTQYHEVIKIFESENRKINLFFVWIDIKFSIFMQSFSPWDSNNPKLDIKRRGKVDFAPPPSWNCHKNIRSPLS